RAQTVPGATCGPVFQVRVQHSEPSAASPGARKTSDRVAGDRVHVAHGLEPLQQAAQLRQILNLDDRADHRSLVVVDLHIRAAQVDLRFGDHRGDITQQPGAIPRLDLDAHRIDLAGTGLPLDVHDALHVTGVAHVHAVGSMHRDALPAGHV